MELIEQILSQGNLKEAIHRVKINKGAPGVDNKTVDELDGYFKKHQAEIKDSIMKMKYRPQAVRRVYIPKANGKKRPLGIPTVVDRVIQQAIAQVLMKIYDPRFSDHSYGFRPKRSAHDAIEQVLEYLDEGYQWVIDLDIEKYFDTVNHDKLISIIREQVNDKTTLHLIRAFLKAGIMEDGLVKPNKLGVPQGGPLSPILSNIYLDKMDKELEQRGVHFVRYADDCNIFVKSKKSADRVMKSISSWLERKLFLKVNATKTKVVRPTKSNFLGFTFWKNDERWQTKPGDDRKAKLYDKIRELLSRRKAAAQPLSVVFTKINQVVRGWINYFKIGDMKHFLFKFSQWMRHKIRVVIIKQWKRSKRIYTNLMRINKALKCNFSDEDIRKVANARLGWYKRSSGQVVNFLLSPQVLGIKKADRPGLVDPLEYYISRKELQM
ncbi:group II intron reverse transcriptase/maturase [Lactobacillus gigeriorum]|uniref:RNA-directed DNA polymerase n=4 Tax=Lactobacillus TaxID=1578 RepID=I7LDP5_9LACO|nr:group II intron reverse transcriptase/maturase [Lactobacillus gigeriorum]CCI87496.1 GBSi1, group II intron, maturase [Lactobacillus gigeriorum DSM 23908 = CRBIP 24.85]